MKRAWAALLVTLIVVLPARLYVTLSLVDPNTGFYTDGGKAAGIVSAVLAAGVIAVLVLGYRKSPGKAAAPLHSIAAAVFAALSGVFIAGQSLSAMAMQKQSEFTAMDNIFYIAGVIAAVSFFVAAYDFAAGETVLHRMPVLALLSSIWGCLCLITLFVNYAATVNRLENVYHTFTVAFMLLFLFSQAKLLSGIDEAKGSKMVFSYGFAAVIFALADAVPNIARYFTGKSLLGLFSIGLHMANIILAVYVLVYLSALQHVKTEAVMVSVAPSVGGNDETPENGDVLVPEQKHDEAGTELQKCENTAEKRALSADSAEKYLEFLKNAYQSEDKFVENRENNVPIAKSIKS